MDEYFDNPYDENEFDNNEDDEFDEDDEDYDDEFEDNDSVDFEYGDKPSANTLPNNLSLSSLREENLIEHTTSLHNSLTYPITGSLREESSLEEFPNGYTRQDYLDAGWSEFEIELWGLNQCSAPDPDSAGFVIPDMLDGDLDGDFDYPFNL